MFANLDASTLMFVAAAIAAAAFFLGIAMDGVMGSDGFGTVGNMVILGTGAFLGLFVASDILMVPSYDSVTNAVSAVTGSFCALAFLAIMKALMRRIFS